MRQEISLSRLAILALITVMGQLLSSCSNEEDANIGGAAPFISVIVDVRNSEGESLLNPATENNYVGQPIKVVIKKWDNPYDRQSVYEATYYADWSEAFWDKDMWRLYDVTAKREYPEERYLLNDCFHILSKDKRIISKTDKLLCIGLFSLDYYSCNFRIEWPDGKIDYIRKDNASVAEKKLYWYVNNRRVQECSYSSPDTPLRIVHK